MNLEGVRESMLGRQGLSFPLAQVNLENLYYVTAGNSWIRKQIKYCKWFNFVNFGL